jgi:hypothetical protein
METFTYSDCEEMADTLVTLGTVTTSDGRTLRLTRSDDSQGMFATPLVVDRRAGTGAWQHAFLSLVSDIQTYGHEVWTVEVIDGTDAFGRPVIRDFESTVTYGQDDPGFAGVEVVAHLIAALMARLNGGTNV